MILLVLLLVLCIFIASFLYQHKKMLRRFEAAGLKYIEGVPVFGNLWKSIFLRRHFIYDLQEVYDAFPDEKYVGFADCLKPVILIRDPELMKNIVVKHFDHFQNRKEVFPVRLDPLLGRNLLQLKDEEWKQTRVKLSPAFTAAKLRNMLPALVNVSKNIVHSLKNHSSQELELTELMYRYTGDAVISAAFGLNQKTAGQEDSAFFAFGSQIFLNVWKRVLIFISLQFPYLGEAIKITTGLQLFPKPMHDFLRQAFSKSLAYREKHHLSIPDYMDVLKEISKESSIDDLAGQVFFAFAASFVSASSSLRFCFHELALNPGIQERLYQEIRTHEETNEITLESISGLKYLDCVLNETSRRWSTAVMMDRVCTKPYYLPPPREGGQPYLVNPGDLVFNVVNPIHMDPKYHANPEVFDPERFSEENKHYIKPFTFMPFGAGPRGCPGGRFAMIEIKVMIYYMVLNFKLLKCEKTSDPIQLQPDEINFEAVGGTWVRLELR